MTDVADIAVRPRRSLDQQIAYMTDQVRIFKAQHPDWPEGNETMRAILESLLMLRHIAMSDHEWRNKDHEWRNK